MSSIERVATLRIKKVYFDRIKSGEKTIEYRDGRSYYAGLLAGRPKLKRLRLHYQGTEILEVEVKSVRLINKPKRFENSPFFKEKKIFAIYLGRVY